MSNLRKPPPLSVSEMIADRHSIHHFLPGREVPKKVLEKVFSAAQNSASNTNLQPWEVKIISGQKLKKIQSRLVKTFRAGIPMNLPPTPPKFQDRQDQMGAVLYGEGFGIRREDKEARLEAIVFNFENYGASSMALFCVDKSFTAPADIASVGIYLENVILLLWEYGLGSIPQASMGGYPQVFEEELGLSDDLQIVCGLAIGYPDENASVVAMRMPKRDWKEAVTFFE